MKGTTEPAESPKFEGVRIDGWPCEGEGFAYKGTKEIQGAICPHGNPDSAGPAPKSS